MFFFKEMRRPPFKKGIITAKPQVFRESLGERKTQHKQK